MSYGLVICSTCRKEVHQDGPALTSRAGVSQQPPATWRHCSRFHGWTPICEGAKAIYPASRIEIVGLFCQADGLAPEPFKETT